MQRIDDYEFLGSPKRNKPKVKKVIFRSESKKNHPIIIIFIVMCMVFILSAEYL